MRFWDFQKWRIQREERGGILLEYVILTTLIILPLVGFNSVMLFNATGIPVVDPHGGTTVTFGFLGDSFMGLYQRIVCGTGLPIP